MFIAAEEQNFNNYGRLELNHDEEENVGNYAEEIDAYYVSGNTD